MKKILQIALRDFIATVATKAFVFGLILPPAIMMIGLWLVPKLMNNAAPKVTGHIALIDQSGDVADRVQSAFSAEEFGKRMAGKAARRRSDAPMPQAAKDIAADSPAMQAIELPPPTLTIQVLPPDTSPDSAKAEILAAGDRDKNAQGFNPRLALAVIPNDAVELGSDGIYKTFDLYTAPKLDFEVAGDIRSEVGRAIVNARIQRDARVRAGGLDEQSLYALMSLPRPEIKSVTATGDKSIDEIAKLMIPFAFMLLLWIATFTCGQYLLSSTIEEKSSRVMEVLLSAVSPMQLLTGKILGQMGAGLLILTLYCGVGVGGLVLASMISILPLINLVYLFVYFVIAFFMIASLMAAVGSAVSDVREAQSLIGPIMIVLIIPMMLWLPILRNPNSMFAQVCSFIPPISPFVMILRLSGSEPVPAWQVVATIALGGVSIWVSLWAAAKVFRIGVLMYGKPPNFATLIKWIRMA